MKTATALAAALLLVVGAFIVSAWSQEDMTQVDTSAFKEVRRAPAPFNHDAHNEKAGIEDCAVCHHAFDDKGNKLEGESSEGTACADCHSLADQGARPGLRKAFHERCKGCHVNERKGPVVCGQCHINR